MSSNGLRNGISNEEAAQQRAVSFSDGVPQDVQEAFKESAKYFPTPLQEFQLYDKYSRFNYDLGRRETWIEVVDRATDYLKELSANRLEKKEYDRIRQFILEMKATPSMRLLAMAGPAARRNNIAIYNCSYLPIDSIDSLVEELLIAMAGCGVGFSVERRYVEKLPEVKMQTGEILPTFQIADSTEGWADAFRLGLTTWFDGKNIQFDYSQIRSAGTPLKIKGGRSSGPEPLKKLLDFTRHVILKRQGKKLRPLDAHDVACTVGETIVSGGVRRTALISLFDMDDEEMRDCKNGTNLEGNQQRWMSNNSGVWDNEMSQQQVLTQMYEMIKGQRGEPGIFSRYNANKIKPTRRKEADFGTNPCFHPDTIIETAHGQKKIYEITEPTYVYSMDKQGKLVLKKASASWISQKNAKTIKITVANGKSIQVTPEHKIFTENLGWIEAKNIEINDRVVALLRQRRGAKYSGIKLTTETKWQMEHRFIWEGVNGDIARGYDINHKDQSTYHNDIDNLELLTHSEHASLTRRTTPNNHQVKDRYTGRWVSGTESKHGVKKIVPMPAYLKSSFHQYATVTKIEEGETVDVYDISVEDTHNVIANGIVAHNCGEINLRPYEFCNLTIAIARPDDTLESLKEKVEVATIIGTIQSMGINFPGLRDIWRQNCEEERLLGVDINGWLDTALLSPQNPDLTKTLTMLKEHAVVTNKKYAEILGINQSVAVTCVKPSGNSSQLFNCSSGIHPRHYKYYIRNVRVQAQSPVKKLLEEAGVPMDPENGQTWESANTFVVHFPIKAPDGAIVKEDVGAIEQCNYWLKAKKYFTEHNPSVTIMYKPNEVIDLIKWVWDHVDIIGGMSFLPVDDAQYSQMPYEKISKEEYEERAKQFPSLDFSQLFLYEKEDYTTSATELACVSGACSIDDYRQMALGTTTP